MNKLVRDKIPEMMRIENKNPEIKILNNDYEYFDALGSKLLEEVHEFLAEKDNAESTICEIADILEVLDAIVEFKKYSNEEIQNCKLKKKLERGGFEKRIFMVK